MGMPIHDYLDFHGQQAAFEHLGAYYQGTVNVSGTDGPVRYDGAFVTASTFDVIDATPQLGRGFIEGEDVPGAEPVALRARVIATYINRRSSSSPSPVSSERPEGKSPSHSMITNTTSNSRPLA